MDAARFCGLAVGALVDGRLEGKAHRMRVVENVGSKLLLQYLDLKGRFEEIEVDDHTAAMFHDKGALCDWATPIKTQQRSRAPRLDAVKRRLAIDDEDAHVAVTPERSARRRRYETPPAGSPAPPVAAAPPAPPVPAAQAVPRRSAPRMRAAAAPAVPPAAAARSVPRARAAAALPVPPAAAARSAPRARTAAARPAPRSRKVGATFQGSEVDEFLEARGMSRGSLAWEVTRFMAAAGKSRANVRCVAQRVRDLTAGVGVKHPQRDGQRNLTTSLAPDSRAVFLAGTPLTLDADLQMLRDDAYIFCAQWGDGGSNVPGDRSNGWLLDHALGWLDRYKASLSDKAAPKRRRFSGVHGIAAPSLLPAEATGGDESDDDVEVECPVCSYDLQTREVTMLDCQHILCNACVAKMVTLHGRVQIVECPLCRFPSRHA
ncbi:hypothetical protein M885DRAFT_585771 [Pelagophyceae sp. CCMP2097]|nr:hypothetical protein M885DRAFT_585771 [Pelagophyceae sp. CCMP2097]